MVAHPISARLMAISIWEPSANPLAFGTAPPIHPAPVGAIAVVLIQDPVLYPIFGSNTGPAGFVSRPTAAIEVQIEGISGGGHIDIAFQIQSQIQIVGFVRGPGSGISAVSPTRKTPARPFDRSRHSCRRSQLFKGHHVGPIGKSHPYDMTPRYRRIDNPALSPFRRKIIPIVQPICGGSVFSVTRMKTEKGASLLHPTAARSMAISTWVVLGSPIAWQAPAWPSISNSNHPRHSGTTDRSRGDTRRPHYPAGHISGSRVVIHVQEDVVIRLAGIDFTQRFQPQIVERMSFTHQTFRISADAPSRPGAGLPLLS